ncbi:MAG: DeoR/GlpR family DNA-binding transcription regulator [Anaerolineae bacterium]|nr:DeoR/GlpR family DNA-binding transcription regulator [Anaerolineae bacterium]
MVEPLFLEERRRLILEELKQKGRVSVGELSTSLNVSTVTIRQDLRTLETEGLLKRTHGGAVEKQSQDGQSEPELSFDIRRNKQTDEKDILGRAAATLIETGSAIALDASTTVCSVIPYIGHLDSLTIVTNNLMVTEALLNNLRVEVLWPGGRLRRDAYSIIGNPDSLPDINLNIGFVSAWGISAEAGLTEVSEDEMKMKRALLSRCLTKVLIVDSTKWGQVAPYTYASPHDMDIIITTSRAAKGLIKQVKHQDIRIIDI